MKKLILIFLASFLLFCSYAFTEIGPEEKNNLPAKKIATEYLTTYDGIEYTISNGYINEGAVGSQGDAYDGVFRLKLNGSSISSYTETTEESGRELVFSQTSGNFNIVKKIYIPSEENRFPRILDLITNNSSTTEYVDIRIYGDMGSDSSTQLITTSDGDISLETSDYYFVSDDSYNGTGDPASAIVMQGPGAEISLSYVILQYSDEFYYEWESVPIAPGDTVGFIYFPLLASTQEEVELKAVDVIDQIYPLTWGMSQAEIDCVVNFNFLGGDLTTYDQVTYEIDNGYISDAHLVSQYDAYDGAFYTKLNGSSISSYAETTEESGRELVFSQTSGNFSIIKKIYIPPEENRFPRILDLITNNGSTTEYVDIRISGNMGSDSSTQLITTSDGDTSLETSDYYFVSDDSYNGTGDPASAIVMQGPGSEISLSYVSLYDYDDFYYEWENVQIGPGDTAGFIYFPLLDSTQEDVELKAFDVINQSFPLTWGMSPSEIDCVVNFNLSSNTVAYYNLNGDGTDSSNNGYDLTVKTDRVSWINSIYDQAASMGVDPWSGSCFYSDGGALTAPGAGLSYPGYGDWTVEAWVKVPDFATGYTVVSHYSEHWAGHDPYQIFISQDGLLKFHIDNGSQSDYIDGLIPVGSGVWFHVAGVYRYLQSLQIYVNGELIAEKATSIAPETLTNYNVFIGGSFCGTSTGLMVDEVRISHASLSPEEFIGWPFNQISQLNVTVQTENIPLLFPTIDLFVSVTDENQQPLTGLTQSNFSVTEDNNPQTITGFQSQGSGADASIAFIMDYSGSMSSGNLTDMESAVTEFITNMFAADRGAIIKFADVAQIKQGFTSNKTDLYNGVNASFTGDAGWTAVYDAITETINMFIPETGRRRAIIVLTDGEDNHSTNTLTDAINAASSAGIPVYTIGLGSNLIPAILQQISSDTGGAYYYAPTSSELSAIYSLINQTLSNLYQITYSTSDLIPNTTRIVEVQVTDSGSNGIGTGEYLSPVTSQLNVTVQTENIPPLFPTIDLFVSVTDENQQPLTGLTQSNFSVTEDNGIALDHPITITDFQSQGSGADASIAIIMDYSGSMSSGNLTDMEIAVTEFITNMFTADRGAIIKFAAVVETKQGFTSNKTDLYNGVNASFFGDTGSTHLYDVIVETVDMFIPETGRSKAIIVLTDGEDFGSTYTLTDAINAARSAGIPVYTIGLGDYLIPAILQQISSDTGGAYYYAPTSNELSAIYSLINQTLSNQYQITYSTPDLTLGTPRVVEVQVTYSGLIGISTVEYFSPGGPGDWRCVMIFTEGANNKTLLLGCSVIATNGIDANLGEIELPPKPVSGVFDVRSTGISIGNGLIKDFHEQGVQEWTIDIQRAAGGNVLIEWSDLSSYSGSFTLQDAFGGALGINVNMKTYTSYTITNANINQVKILYSSTGSWDISLYSPQIPFWNMVSLGLDLIDKSRSSVFPGSISLWGFDNGYNQADPMVIGKGYWLNMGSTLSVTLQGTAIETLTLNLNAGWNMIGMISNPVVYSDIIQNPPGVITSIYGFDGTSYVLITNGDILEQGKGFWINMLSNGSITLGSSGSSKPAISDNPIAQVKENNFEIPVIAETGYGQRIVSFFINDENSSDTSVNKYFELPPLPPSDAFDVRITQDGPEGFSNVLIDKDKLFESRIEVKLPSGDGQVLLRWDRSKLEPEKYFLANGNNLVDMALTDRIVFEGNADLKFTYKGNNIVSAYNLMDNYPNPFNPFTTIGYSIKSSGFVKLVIYNVLGQEIKRLVYDYKESGQYNVVWNGKDNYGTDVACGIYLYKIRVNDFVKIKRMLYIK